MAMAIFVVHGVAPKELNITMSDCIRGIWPFVFLVLVGLALCVAFPETILWLPGKMIK
jgi:TRAP-type mannitol/chloroaromatic compound transport system permease large subunit